MFWRTPEAGAGISASTLSVEISNSGSSRWILSPGFFSHLVMVPSTMDSPIWGITMSVGIISFHLARGLGPNATCNYSEAGERDLAADEIKSVTAETAKGAKKNRSLLCVLCGFSLRAL